MQEVLKKYIFQWKFFWEGLLCKEREKSPLAALKGLMAWCFGVPLECQSSVVVGEGPGNLGFLYFV